MTPPAWLGRILSLGCAGRHSRARATHGRAETRCGSLPPNASPGTPGRYPTRTAAVVVPAPGTPLP
jgi:hypothetical protein